MLSDDTRLEYATNCLQLIEFEATGALPLAAPKSVLQHVTNITLNHVVVVIAKVLATTGTSLAAGFSMYLLMLLSIRL